MNPQGNSQNRDALWGRKGWGPAEQGLETAHHLRSETETIC